MPMYDPNIDWIVPLILYSEPTTISSIHLVSIHMGCKLLYGPTMIDKNYG